MIARMSDRNMEKIKNIISKELSDIKKKLVKQILLKDLCSKQEGLITL